MFKALTTKALSLVLALAFVASTTTVSQANHTAGRTGWNKAAGDMAVWWHLDGKIITLRNEDTGGFLRQGYGASNDAKRNVEADRGMITAPRGKGFDWVLKPAGDGYWYIVNLKTALFLTQGGSPSKFENVVNWGWHPGADDNYKWKFIQAENRSRDRGFTEGFYRRHLPDEYQNYETGNSTSSKQLFVADVVKASIATNTVCLEAKNKFKVGDSLTLLTPTVNIPFKVGSLRNTKSQQALEAALGSGYLVDLEIPELAQHQLSIEQLSKGLLHRS